jgi:peptide/nickel transport system substrate-binding protein
MRHRWARKAVWLGALATVTVAAVVGSGVAGAAGSHRTAQQGTVRLANGYSGNFIANFNPFSPNAMTPTNGIIYEPLFFFNTIRAGSVRPWLATSYTWSNAGKSITFQLRKNVKWSDGVPFTSADVAFTFGLAAQHPALNRFGLPFTTISTNGPYSVTVNFKTPEYTSLVYFAGQQVMLPQHIWKDHIADASTWTNPNPVGTGAFVVTKASGQVMALDANPSYYMAGLPQIKTLEYLSFSGNTSADAAINSGEIDWSSNYIANIEKTYLARNKKFQLVNIPLAVAFFVPNMKQGPLTNVAVRKAVSYAINRQFISKTVYGGHAPMTNADGLLTPNYQIVQDPSATSDLLSYNPAKAASTLTAAGFKKGSNGMFDNPDGSPLVINIQVISGYSDYVSILQIAQQELKQAGIDLEIKSESSAEFNANRAAGNFDAIIDNYGYTSSPYVYYHNMLSSDVTRPIGQAENVGNYGRYSNPSVDKLLDTIAGTTSLAAQKKAFSTIEKTFVSEVPLIPLFDQQAETEYNGAHIAGFPTNKNRYAAPPIWLFPDNAWVALHLKAVGS